MAPRRRNPAAPPPKPLPKRLSKAELLRREGNREYARVGEGNEVEAELRRSHLLAAIDKYKASLEASATEAERAAAYKGLGKAFTLGPYLVPRGEQTLRLNCQAVEYFSLAARHGGGGAKGAEWVEMALDLATAAFHEALEQIKALPDREMKRWMDALRRGVGAAALDDLAPWMLHDVAESLMLRGVQCREADDLSAALDINADARRPLQEGLAAARRAARAEGRTGAGAEPDDEVMAELLLLEGDVELQDRIYHSSQMILSGDAALSKSLRGEETINMDGVWAAIDCFQEAVLKAREVDLESEAVALGRLASAYDGVLKDKRRAQPHARRALQLAQALYPKQFTQEGWYRDCLALLARYQADAVAEDDAEAAALRAPFLEELAEELAALRVAAAEGAGKLLTHVYAAHPPQDPDHTLGEAPTPANTKGLLLQATKHYQGKEGEEGGLTRAAVLRQEISKELSARYSEFK